MRLIGPHTFEILDLENIFLPFSILAKNGLISRELCWYHGIECLTHLYDLIFVVRSLKDDPTSDCDQFWAPTTFLDFISDASLWALTHFFFSSKISKFSNFSSQNFFFTKFFSSTFCVIMLKKTSERTLKSILVSKKLFFRYEIRFHHFGKKSIFLLKRPKFASALRARHQRYYQEIAWEPETGRDRVFTLA